MPRKINPRRIVLEQLTAMKRTIKYLIPVWDITMTVSEPYRDDDGRTTHRWRARREDEKPENRAEAWAHAHGVAGQLREQATALERMAWMEYQEALRLRTTKPTPEKE